MKNIDYIDKLENIITDKDPIKGFTFKNRLQGLVDNFYNLKLEIYIRNILVELFNNKYFYENRAIAEYPRNTFKNRRRVSIDFSLLKNSKVQFTMEMKYNFPKDSTCFLNYNNVIESNFINRKWDENRKVDAFLLIVCETERDKLSEIEKNNFEPNLNCLSQYQLTQKQIEKFGENSWENNLIKTFNRYSSQQEFSYRKLHKITLTNVDGLLFKFHFYILFRN